IVIVAQLANLHVAQVYQFWFLWQRIIPIELLCQERRATQQDRNEHLEISPAHGSPPLIVDGLSTSRPQRALSEDVVEFEPGLEAFAAPAKVHADEGPIEHVKP